MVNGFMLWFFAHVFLLFCIVVFAVIKQAREEFYLLGIDLRCLIIVVFYLLTSFSIVKIVTYRRKTP